MMSKKPARVQFNGGELSPWLGGRVDIAKYDKTAKLCRNFIPLTEGALKRRGGTRFVATTPEQAQVTFQIETVPVNARVLINRVETNAVVVAVGDEVYYEVSADGYATASGKVTVIKNTTLRVVLVSVVERFTFQITAVPASAVVKINDVVRSSYVGAKNETVSYVVKCDGYKLKSGSLMLTKNTSITVTLEAESEGSGTYGAWGDLQGFIACTAYGYVDQQKKCFIIRFSNGYLPVLFDANRTAPKATDFKENMFISSETDGYDALTVLNGVKRLAVIHRTQNAIFYKDVNGTQITGFDAMTMMMCGWQLDEDGKYAAVYRYYDGSVSGHTLRVYYKGAEVWKLEGRANG